MSKCCKKPCYPLFLITTNKTKHKKILHTFVDIAKETACEKIQRTETLLELELLQFFVSLYKRPDLWKSLSTIIYIVFHCRNTFFFHWEKLSNDILLYLFEFFFFKWYLDWSTLLPIFHCLKFRAKCGCLFMWLI